MPRPKVEGKPKGRPTKKSLSVGAVAKKKHGGKRPGAGRPKVKIDWKTVDTLCQLQCTHEEIGAVVNHDVNTLFAACKRDHNLDFSDYWRQKAAGGKASLRRAQWQQATSGNPTLLIWLGKAYLGQSDRPDGPGDGEKAKPVKFEFVTVDARRTEDNKS